MAIASSPSRVRQISKDFRISQDAKTPNDSISTALSLPGKSGAPNQLGRGGETAPNINPISASAAELMIDVETPDGKMFAIDDPALDRQSACRISIQKHRTHTAAFRKAP